MNFFQSTLFLFSWFLICFSCSKTPNWSATFNEAGLVNVQELDSTIKVKLAYSSSNNVIGYDIYGDLDQAYLRPEAAKKLVIAQKNLQAHHSTHSLHTFDATRPRRIQQLLWNESELPIGQRSEYIAHPQKGSIHNYGMVFDDFSVLSHITSEDSLLSIGALKPEHVQNRKLLRQVMTTAGFLSLSSEWWHFDAMERSSTKEQFEIVE